MRDRLVSNNVLPLATQIKTRILIGPPNRLFSCFSRFSFNELKFSGRHHRRRNHQPHRA